MSLRDDVTEYEIVRDIFQRRRYVTSWDVFVGTKSLEVGQLEGIPGRKISSGFAVEFAPFKRASAPGVCGYRSNAGKTSSPLGAVSSEGTALYMYVDVRVSESLRLDRGACTSSSSKHRKARGFPLSLSSTARTLRINLRTRDRAGTLPRVLSGFIASPSGALDRRRCYTGSRASYSLKSFERDRGVRNFVRIADVLIDQANIYSLTLVKGGCLYSKRLRIVCYVKNKDS